MLLPLILQQFFNQLPSEIPPVISKGVLSPAYFLNCLESKSLRTLTGNNMKKSGVRGGGRNK